ncbi:MAG: DUF2231 domain-containing protein [Polyangia bacterium]|jgi:uncharacterized membrane protein
MLTVVRLVTIHPVLTHFTIGGLPLIVIGYAIAVWRRSPAWTLVGDAALVVTAVLTLFTFAFGLVSNFVLPWPGGIAIWRWVHLGFGVATTVALVTFAALRLRYRRPGVAAHASALVGVVIVAGLILFTGWVGGEVLVYHSGMAVGAAADGALALPVGHSEPKDFLGAMRQVRGSWASIETQLAWMLVHHPRDQGFSRIEADARRLGELTGRMVDFGAKAPHSADTLVALAEALGGDADDIAEAAKDKSLQKLAHAVGEASSTCADCHEAVRWK